MEIRDKQASSEAFLSQVYNRFKAIEKELKSFDNVHSPLSSLDCAASKYDKTSLLTKRVDIENCSRHNNLIIRGLTEDDK